MEDSVGDGEGRLVARLGALAFDGFNQRGFFSADIAAGADEKFQLEMFPDQALAMAAVKFLLQDFFLSLVFVAEIENAASRAGEQAGDDHAFDNQVGKMMEDKTVL